jgi:hypothetical protein
MRDRAIGLIASDLCRPMGAEDNKNANTLLEKLRVSVVFRETCKNEFVERVRWTHPVCETLLRLFFRG